MSDRVQTVMGKAQCHASGHGRGKVDVVDIWKGIVEEGRETNNLCLLILEDLGVNIAEISVRVSERQPLPDNKKDRGLTPRAEKAICEAFDEHGKLGNGGGQKVGIECLLLGLCLVENSEVGIALEEVGVTPDKIRNQIRINRGKKHQKEE